MTATHGSASEPVWATAPGLAPTVHPAKRLGPAETDLVNPGSVGMPLDGDPRAGWAIRREDGDLELRRTAYDVTPAVAKMRGYDWGERVAQRLLHGRDPGS